MQVDHSSAPGMTRGTPTDLLDNEPACRDKAASLRIMAEQASSPEPKARTLEIAAEWKTKADGYRQPIARPVTQEDRFSAVLYSFTPALTDLRAVYRPG
jgi:hypothetical protein